MDSTDNVLSHEVFETITDPEGTARWSSMDNGLFGEEIGDECSFVIPHFFDPFVIRVGRRQYAVQLEYDNNEQACTAGN